MPVAPEETGTRGKYDPSKYSSSSSSSLESSLELKYEKLKEKIREINTKLRIG
jgi:hypothetical protein